MPRPSTSPTNLALQAQMGATLESIRIVVDALRRFAGISHSRIAQQSRMHSSYLSPILNGKPANPSAKVVSGIILALVALCEDHQLELSLNGEDGTARTELETLAQRYQLTWPVWSPVGDAIDDAAVNYVRRAADRAIEAWIHQPGNFTIYGMPGSSSSTLARRVVSLATQRGYRVGFVDAALVLPFDPDSQASLVAAINVAVGAAEAGQTQTNPTEIFQDWLPGGSGHSVLVIDNINAGSARRHALFAQLLREWSNRRYGPAHKGSGWEYLGVWNSQTTPTPRYDSAPKYGFIRQGNEVAAQWFSYEETRSLVETYANRHGLSEPWVEQAANRAYPLFAGQPLLTHQFISDCVGSKSAVYEVAPRVDNAYGLHLLALAEVIVGDRRATQVVSESSSTAVVGKSDLLDQLGVADSHRSVGWTNQFYAEHLPIWVGKMLSRQQ